MGFELGGEAGARLGKNLCYPGSADTILRLVKRAELSAASSPRVVGLDDWSWKRRLRYGTLICDLESHHPIDVLPDREAATLEKWLKEHEGVEIISRDRGGPYEEGARAGAPGAQQEASRFHLLVNLSDALKPFFNRKTEAA
jgi:transposase